MEEWVWKKLATDLDQDTFEKVRAIFDYCPIDSMLDNNVLNLILTRVPVRDYKHVSLVSRRWHGICQRPEYWLAHIHRALTPLYPLPIVQKVNPFLFRKLPLAQKVGWLFSDSWIRGARAEWSTDAEVFISCRDVTFWMHHIGKRKTEETFTETFTASYPSPSGEQFYEIFPLRSRGLLENGKKTCELCHPTNHYNIAGPVNDGDFCDCNWILFKRKNGDVYEGEPLVKDMQNNWLDILPHGKGIWRFADGTTLTGDKVAFDGLPHGTGINQDGQEETWFAGEKREKKRRKM